MLVIVGLVVLLVAVIVGFTGALLNAGPAHPLTENFDVFGYHVTGSTGTLFLFGIVIGAVAMLGLSVLLAGAQRSAGRGRAARRELDRSRRETAFLNQERDRRLEHDQDHAVAASAVPPQRAVPSRSRDARFAGGGTVDNRCAPPESTPPVGQPRPIPPARARGGGEHRKPRST